MAKVLKAWHRKSTAERRKSKRKKSIRQRNWRNLSGKRKWKAKMAKWRYQHQRKLSGAWRHGARKRG